MPSSSVCCSRIDAVACVRVCECVSQMPLSLSHAMNSHTKIPKQQSKSKRFSFSTSSATHTHQHYHQPPHNVSLPMNEQNLWRAFVCVPALGPFEYKSDVTIRRTVCVCVCARAIVCVRMWCVCVCNSNAVITTALVLQHVVADDLRGIRFCFCSFRYVQHTLPCMRLYVCVWVSSP